MEERAIKQITKAAELFNDAICGNLLFRPDSWLNGNAFISVAKGLSFKSRVGQIKHSVVNDLLLLRHFVERSCVGDRAR